MSKKNPIQLSDHFTYSRLFRFVLPSIVMMVFTSIYGVVDGLFVSNFAGKTAFASINLIMPFLIILGAMGFMLGTGGTALVSRVLGEGDKACANKYFSNALRHPAGRYPDGGRGAGHAPDGDSAGRNRGHGG